jgi:hypothetical protein
LVVIPQGSASVLAVAVAFLVVIPEGDLLLQPAINNQQSAKSSKSPQLGLKIRV